jgi:phosphohistidine phosphatase SixA
MTLFPGLALTLDESIKPGGDVYSVLGAIEGLDVRHFLIVSHNPFLSNLLSVMVDGTMESQRDAALRIYECCSFSMR